MTPDEHPWFAEKTFGYGAGLPIAWQGWVMMAVLMAGPIGLIPVFMPAHPGYFALAVIGYTTVWMPLMAKKTRGGWKWRNGRK